MTTALSTEDIARLTKFAADAIETNKAFGVEQAFNTTAAIAAISNGTAPRPDTNDGAISAPLEAAMFACFIDSDYWA